MGSPAYAWMDGEIVPWDKAKVHIAARVVTSGLGAFEGVRAYWQSDSKQLLVFRLHDHVCRLLQSARIYGMEPRLTVDDIESGCVELLQQNSFEEDCYLRPCIYQGNPWGAPRSVKVSIFNVPRSSHLGIREFEGIRCNISTWRRIPDFVLPPRAKMNGNYLQLVIASNESKASGYEEPIHLTVNGKVSEPPGANIFIVRDNTLITPSTSSDILEGITRDSIIKLVADNMPDVKCVERTVDRTELYISDEVFLCGTGHAEITPVISVDNLSIGNGKPGVITCSLRALYYDVVHSKVEKYSSWLTPVRKAN